MDRPVKKSNELIKRRKKKVVIKRSILTLIFFMIVLVTLCLKLPFFAVENIIIENNNYIDSETISMLSGISNGKNIFYINKKNSEKNIASNAYIAKVEINRKLPNTILIKVQEREATLYFILDNKYIILDNQGMVLEVKDTIENLNLVRVEGIKTNNVQVGKPIDLEEERVRKILIQLAGLIQRNISGIKMDYIDLSNLSDIRIHSSQLYFKIGDSYDIEGKLNKALNIAAKDDIKSKKGYVDVSFEGNPVLYIE